MTERTHKRPTRISEFCIRNWFRELKHTKEKRMSLGSVRIFVVAAVIRAGGPRILTLKPYVSRRYSFNNGYLLHFLKELKFFFFALSIFVQNSIHLSPFRFPNFSSGMHWVLPTYNNSCDLKYHSESQWPVSDANTEGLMSYAPRYFFSRRLQIHHPY